jgi:hypothetical protein
MSDRYPKQPTTLLVVLRGAQLGSLLNSNMLDINFL